MGWFDNDDSHGDTQAYNQYQSAPKHESHLSHELIAGAASYEAAKAYEEHVARNGKPDDHAKAKEIIAGFAGAFIDKQVETHGLDFIDRKKAEHEAKKRTDQCIDQYGGY